jgi:hypothetical protein
MTASPECQYIDLYVDSRNFDIVAPTFMQVSLSVSQDAYVSHSISKITLFKVVGTVSTY